MDSSNLSSEQFETFRRCALAILNCGTPLGIGKSLTEQYPDFKIDVSSDELTFTEAPPQAFVDGHLIEGIKEHVYSVLRDLVFNSFHPEELSASRAVYGTLSNAKALKPESTTVVCWGGHSISEEEYQYSKNVGYELGLRGMDICTGSGSGAMKGPMKGAMIGHAKQRIKSGRYLGLTEVGIISSEAPNAINNELVVFPDIEKRLEAFVRVGHGIVIFPGGVGTAEEIFYLLSILLNPDNASVSFPLIFTGPESSYDYWAAIDSFIGFVLGEEAQCNYRVILGNPESVARIMSEKVEWERGSRNGNCFNWGLRIDKGLQQPFIPTHTTMAGLDLCWNQQPHRLASNLRKAFSGIVAGNVKDAGMAEIEKYGPFEIHGNSEVMEKMDALLESFIAQGRMKLRREEYVSCYKIIDETKPSLL